MNIDGEADDGALTCKRSIHAGPPPTFSPTKVIRASSTRSNALAIQRSASYLAAGSRSVDADMRSKKDKLGASAMISEPAISRPRAFRVDRACAASERRAAHERG